MGRDSVSEAIVRRASEFDDEHRRMFEAILDRMANPGSGQEQIGWERYGKRLLAAHDGGEPLEQLIEHGYWRALFFRKPRVGPPQTEEDWSEMLVFRNADEIRKRAAGDR